MSRAACAVWHSRVLENLTLDFGDVLRQVVHLLPIAPSFNDEWRDQSTRSPDRGVGAMGKQPCHDILALSETGAVKKRVAV